MLDIPLTKLGKRVPSQQAFPKPRGQNKIPQSLKKAQTSASII